MNYEDFFAIHELWKKWKCCSQCMNYETILFAIHELWNICLKHKNYERVKIFVCNTGIMNFVFCNTWIMKLRKCLFAIHELLKRLFNNSIIQLQLWKYLFAKTWIMKTWKGPFETQELWKVKIFVCNTGIMKYFVCNTWIMKI